ncbi:NRDE family protein [Polyangium sp. y55x31]|uniref:NRDE family protein n=1 Tax=Polyangium sp. y55x31 TaxID=3042688 RepID=UPI002482FF80|nr:NRDE family protein [Polyangium sp. y55x31]MDI1476462.1 NRDE family protein [Polyangium sp. y55x31]
MCVLFLGFGVHPDFDVVLAANRDEVFARPTRETHFWEDHPEILAGRDLQSGGTWLGVTRSGRFAAITNFRDPAAHRADAQSRGALVVEYLLGEGSPHEYTESLRPRAREYNGFNLIVGTRGEAAYFASQTGESRRLAPGVYGLSNHLLDTPWPKLVQGKGAFTKLVGEHPLPGPEAFFQMLHSEQGAPDAELPDTGVGLEMERMLAPLFIDDARRPPFYGTRSSSVVTFAKTGEVRFLERSFSPGTEPRLVERGFRLSQEGS